MVHPPLPITQKKTVHSHTHPKLHPTPVFAFSPTGPGVKPSPQLLMRGHRHLGPTGCTMVFPRLSLSAHCLTPQHTQQWYPHTYTLNELTSHFWDYRAQCMVNIGPVFCMSTSLSGSSSLPLKTKNTERGGGLSSFSYNSSPSREREG